MRLFHFAETHSKKHHKDICLNLNKREVRRVFAESLKKGVSLSM